LLLLSGEDDDAAHPVVFGSKLYGWHTAVTQDFRTQHYEKTVYKEKVDTATWNGQATWNGYAKICKSKHPVGNVLCIQTRATAASMNIMKIPDGAMFEALPGARKWGLLCYMQGSCNKAQAEASEKRKAADEERMGGAPVLGANLVLITGAVSGEVEMEDGADKVYLIEKFLGKVTNSNVRKGWAKTHLGAEKVDIEASGCYFVKWQGYSKMSDIEICEKISDGDSVPNDIFARFVRIYESEPAPKKKR
jgi:hypothetical protein